MDCSLAEGLVKGLGMGEASSALPNLIRIAMTLVVKGRGRLPDRPSYFVAVPDTAAA